MESYFCAYHAEVVEIIMVRSCIFVNPTKISKLSYSFQQTLMHSLI